MKKMDSIFEKQKKLSLNQNIQQEENKYSSHFISRYKELKDQSVN
jgi:hypothetical protein